MSYQEISDEVSRLLRKNPEWEKRYEKYKDEISNNKANFEKLRKAFHKWGELDPYAAVSKRNSCPAFDLRFRGESVAEIVLKKEGVYLKDVKSKKSHKKFNFSPLGKTVDWRSPEAKDFRKGFSDICPNLKGHSPEHYWENRLLREFNKHGTGKSLSPIKPVTLFGCFFQMPTPLSASKERIKYAFHNGGGIDILSRITLKDKFKGKGGDLCVMEIKDENKKEEPPDKVMEQAVAYATFIAHLIRSKSGSNWYDFFGFKSYVLKDKITIAAAVVMPDNGCITPNFCNEHPLTVAGLNPMTSIKLYSLYFKNSPGFSFSGSLKDALM